MKDDKMPFFITRRNIFYATKENQSWTAFLYGDKKCLQQTRKLKDYNWVPYYDFKLKETAYILVVPVSNAQKNIFARSKMQEKNLILP